MKQTSILSLAVLVLIAAACSPKNADEAGSSDSTAVATDQPPAKPVTVVTWNEIGVRETPSEKGKYVTSVYLSEHVTLTGDTASEKSGTKRNHYHKVTLSDGKTGWLRDEFIAIDVYPAVVMEESQIMKRPDPATVTEKKFFIGDLVVVKNRDGEYVEVTGKITADKWYSTGYVKSSNLSFDNIEIQYATVKRRTADETKENLRNALMAQLVDASVFGNSALFRRDNEPEVSDEGEEFTGDGEDPGNYVFQPIQEDLIAYYPMNDATPNNSEDQDKNMKKFGNITEDSDKSAYGSSLAFDGRSYISANPRIPVTVPFTVSAYFKLADPKLRDQCIVARGRSSDGTGFNFGYSLDESGSPVVYLGLIGSKPVGVNVPVDIAAGEWVFLTATFDGHNASMYINGQLAGEAEVSDEDGQLATENLANSTMPLEIGRELGLPGRYFKGSIDNVCLWDRVLSSDEINEMYK